MLKTISIAKALVLDDSGNMLVLRRSGTHPTRGGKVDFPGGEVNKGEGFEDALIREIAEETGLKVSLDNLSAVYSGTEVYDSLSRVRVFFLVQLDSAKPEVKISWEHESAEWRPVSEMAALAEEFHSFYHDALLHIVNNKLL